MVPMHALPPTHQDADGETPSRHYRITSPGLTVPQMERVLRVVLRHRISAPE